MGVDIKFLYDGVFYLESNIRRDRLSYRKKLMYIKKDVDPDLISKIELESFILEGTSIKDVKELWFAKSGVPLRTGMKQIRVDRDIVEMCGDSASILEIYVIHGVDVSPQVLLDEDAKMKPTCVGPSKKHIPLSAGPSISIHIDSGSQLTSKATQNSFEKTALVPFAPTSSLVVVDEDDGEEILGSESSDDDDVVYETNIFEESDEDDVEFEENVDKDVFDEAITNEDGAEHGEDVFDVQVDEEVYISSSSDEGKAHKQRYPEFNHLVDFKKKICLKKNMTFASGDVFRKALKQYAIENGFDFYYLHNDKVKISAYCMNKCSCPIKHSRKHCVCKNSICEFKATARRMGNDGSFQLKNWIPEHVCGWQDNNSKVDAVWLAQKYLEHYRDDPQWRIKHFISTVKREYKVTIKYHQAWRARLRAIMMTQGYAPEQYAKVWDYAATVMKYNLGSSVYVRPEPNTEHPEKPIFQRFYVCLQACKEGFKAGCRPIIGLDGCHLKGAYTGQVLSAVAKDGNENIFPVAFAVVEAEKKSTWCWFLENLIRDIGGEALTFMSDRQKGLLEALKVVAPTADTRVCVRHLQNNFSKQWAGKAYKDSVYAAAKAATLSDFQREMESIKDMDEKAYSYLMKQDPATWSLHGFRHYAKSDMLLNNACESFNSCILPAREMSILSMCEWIRRKLMKMFITKRAKMEAYKGVLTPEATKRLNELRADSLQRCNCIGDRDNYEVDCCGKTYVVDLVQRTCGCNMWDLTGMPCIHAICCLLKRRNKLEEYVSPYYYKETYMKSYALSVNPMPGQDQWEKTPYPPLLPPKLIIQPGRPKKSRNRELGEQASTKQTRVRTRKNRCGNCGEEGHIRKTCKNPPKPVETRHASAPNRNTGGRPPSQNTMPTNPRKRKYVRKEVRAEPMPEARAEPNQPRSVTTTASVQMGSEADYDVDALVLQEMNQPLTQASQTQAPPTLIESMRPVTARKFIPMRSRKISTSSASSSRVETISTSVSKK